MRSTSWLMRGKREALIQYLWHTMSCKIHPNVQTNVSEAELENISTKPIMDILNSVANHEGLSSSDVEDWLNVENELQTSPQLSGEQIFESVVGLSSF